MTIPSPYFKPFLPHSRSNKVSFCLPSRFLQQLWNRTLRVSILPKNPSQTAHPSPRQGANWCLTIPEAYLTPSSEVSSGILQTIYAIKILPISSNLTWIPPLPCIFFLRSETLPQFLRFNYKNDNDHDNDGDNKKLQGAYYVPGTILSTWHNLA